jgi:TetR/AcrR family transcriptional repressor of nem operon
MTDRKHQILDAAANFLQTRSYTSFSYQDLSDRLGITKAAIHGHFRTKEKLGVALIDRYQTNARNRLKAISNSTPDPWDRFDAFIDSMYRNFLKNEKICPIGALQSEFQVIPYSMQQRVGHLRQIVTNWLEDTLKAGRDEGSMAFPGNPEEQAALIFAALQGALQNARADGHQIFHTVVNQIKKGIMVRAD